MLGLFSDVRNKGEKLLADRFGRANPIRKSRITVPKKTKTPSKEAVSTSANLTPSVDSPAERGSRRRPAKPNKSPAKRTTTKPLTAKNVSTGKASRSTQPTDEDIRLRAYFIAERRHRLALPGDADSDWLEAKRQLLLEIGR
jgi:hypothetical protein